MMENSQRVIAGKQRRKRKVKSTKRGKNQLQMIQVTMKRLRKGAKRKRAIEVEVVLKIDTDVRKVGIIIDMIRNRVTATRNIKQEVVRDLDAECIIKVFVLFIHSCS